MLTLPDHPRSLWRESYAASHYPTLQQNITVDVAIVGGGITGLTTAYLLKRRGLRVAVLEKDTVGAGTTGRTTGKVTSQHGIIYDDLLKRHGREAAEAYATLQQSAVEQVATIIEQEQIDCDWSRENNYIFTTEASHMVALQMEAAVASELGLPATFVAESPLPFDIKGAVMYADQGRFNAQKYVLGLAAIVDGDGSFIFERSNVVRIHEGGPCSVSTKRGTVQAHDIIVATNVPTLPLAARGTYCLREYPQESYVVAGKTDMDLPGMYISPDNQHYSILPVTVGDDKYLLIGGGGHLSGLRVSTNRHFKQLAEYAERYFGITEITHHWSDRDYLSYDRLPLIGRLYESSQHLFVASAYGKWGLSGGTSAGMVLTDLITGTANPYEALLSPHRPGLVRSFPRAVKDYISSR